MMCFELILADLKQLFYFKEFKEINKNPAILIIPTFSTCTSAQPTSYEKRRSVFQWLSPTHFPLAVESSLPSDCWVTQLLNTILMIPFPGLIVIYSSSLEKTMAPHSSTLAWKIPWTEEPGRLQSMGSLRVGRDWATSLWLFTFMHWRRKWQPSAVFLPGESQEWGSLVGCCLWGRTE